MTRERPEPNCAGRAPLFTATDEDSHRQAAGLCLGAHGEPGCPMLAGCRDQMRQFRADKWGSGMHGTWAGKLFKLKETAN